MRGKFVCNHVIKSAHSERPVFSAVDEAEWSKYTPSGILEFDLSVEASLGTFIPGKKYYVDVTPDEG